ncbi:MAG: LAGLIDADG family homing endonuclease [Candidatus Omnitrophica bacterium]|nr:LAGLIDADG family homing endonuclease [Candidatus Omnitrophota bacterium]
MVEIPPESISGYVTGEGCFYAESGRDPKYRLGYRIRLAFCIEVRESDREILEGIKKKLTCGNIYTLDFGRYKGYEKKNWNRHVKYRVSNFSDISTKVIPFFKKYPLFGMKRKAFEVYCKIAEGICRREHITCDGLEKLKVLVNQLKALNKKGL